MERSEGRTLFVIIVIPISDRFYLVKVQPHSAARWKGEPSPSPKTSNLPVEHPTLVHLAMLGRIYYHSATDRIRRLSLFSVLIREYSRGEGRKHRSSLWRRRRGVGDWWQFPFPWQGCGPEDRALSYIRGNWLDAWNFFPPPSGSETRRAECKSFVSISSL